MNHPLPAASNTPIQRTPKPVGPMIAVPSAMAQAMPGPLSR
jgi:hypothetical protein